MRWRVFLVTVLLSCGKQQGTLQITTGPETDVFTKDPKPTQIVVEAFATDGMSTRIGQAALPATTVELTEQKKTAVATLRITARDDQNKILVQGSSLLLELGVLGDRTLQIFVQRTGELARMPGALGDAREDPTLSVLAGRYILVVGGTDLAVAQKTQLYDLMSLTAITSPPVMPLVPKSIAPVDIGEVLLADDVAKVYDFSSSTYADLPLPSGGTFTEVSGGPTVEGDKGVQFIVGPARASGAPTDKILKVTPGGTASFLKLGQARLGAGACWVKGRGLVVLGGSAMGAGIEIVPPESAPVPVTAFAADPSMGVAAPLSGSKVVFASAGAARVLDLACEQGCTAMPFGASGDPIVHVLGLGDDVFALRRAADGTAHAFRLGANAEIPFKIPRKNAHALRLPTGSIAVVGGSNVIESFAF